MNITNYKARLYSKYNLYIIYYNNLPIGHTRDIWKEFAEIMSILCGLSRDNYHRILWSSETSNNKQYMEWKVTGLYIN